MTNLRKSVHPGTGQECWVDKQGAVHSIVRTGNPNVDCKEYVERSQAEALVAAWGWPPHSKVEKVEERPDGLTHDFDCTNSANAERVAVEIKQLTLPTSAMKAAAQKRGVEFPVSDFLRAPADLIKKANSQLAHAQAARRCVLLVWQYERVAEDMWDLLTKALGCLDIRSYENVDEVWLTTLHLRQFYRVEWE